MIRVIFFPTLRWKLNHHVNCARVLNLYINDTYIFFLHFNIYFENCMILKRILARRYSICCYNDIILIKVTPFFFVFITSFFSVFLSL